MVCREVGNKDHNKVVDIIKVREDLFKVEDKAMEDKAMEDKAMEVKAMEVKAMEVKALNKEAGSKVRNKVVIIRDLSKVVGHNKEDIIKDHLE